MHADEADSGLTQCKKYCRIGSTGCTDEDLILRLKRWLVAGCDDRDWDPTTKRTQHLRMGGVGLRDFADGLSTADLDRIVGGA